MKSNELFIAGLVMAMCAVAHAQTPITDCCTISSPGLYQLQNDIYEATGACIVIDSSDVVFDGQDHTIDYEASAGYANTGIHVHNDSGLAVACSLAAVE